ncbi:cell surface protein, partial [Lactiplantibacillus plantarum]
AQAAQTMNYSSDQIQATRAELAQAGFNASQYTDAQIEAILQQASLQHMSLAQAARSLQ